MHGTSYRYISLQYSAGFHARTPSDTLNWVTLLSLKLVSSGFPTSRRKLVAKSDNFHDMFLKASASASSREVIHSYLRFPHFLQTRVRTVF
jgi:hypothetical protein